MRPQLKGLRLGTLGRPDRSLSGNKREVVMRGILLWAVGVPIPVIILLYLFGVF
jgi:hypothetical protein